MMVVDAYRFALALAPPRSEQLDPANIGASVSLSNGNKTATGATGAWRSAAALDSAPSGKLYWEVSIDAASNLTYVMGGITAQKSSLGSYMGDVSSSTGLQAPSGAKYIGLGSDTATAVGATFTVGSRMCFAWDVAGGNLWLGQDGSFANGQDPASGANPVLSGLPTDAYPGLSMYNGAALTIRLAAADQAYSPPAGFSAYAP